MGIALSENKSKDGVRILRVEGDVDRITNTELEKRLFKLLSFKTPTVLVDLSKVAFISSAGLGVLLGCNSMADERRKKFILFGASAEVRKAMELVGLIGLVGYADTHEEALKLAAGAVKDEPT